MEEDLKSKLIMDKKDLAGDESEGTGLSSDKIPEFFRKRYAEQFGESEAKVTVTPIEENHDFPTFNVMEEAKEKPDYRDPYAEMLGLEPGTDPEDYQAFEKYGPKHTRETVAERQKQNSERIKVNQEGKRKSVLRFDDEKPVKQERTGVIQ